MKLDTCSWFSAQAEDAFYVSVSRTKPNDTPITVAGDWSAVHPSAALLKAFRAKEVNEAAYRDAYLKHLESNRGEVLRGFRRVVNAAQAAGKTRILFVCWEPQGKFCHRNILASWLVSQLRKPAAA